MRRFGVKVVARPIEIDGQHGRAGKPILSAVSVEHHEQGFFGHAVGSVRLFWVAVPKISFLEWYGREFWISANGADLHELFQPADARGLNEVQAHCHAGVKEPAGMEAV